MKVDVSKKSDVVTVEIVIPKADIDSKVKSIAKESQPKATIPGFRKGKAPLDVIIKTNRQQIMKKVSDDLLMPTIEQVINENKIRWIANPILREEYRQQSKSDFLGKVLSNGDLKFVLDIATAPDLDPVGYEDLEAVEQEDLFDDWYMSSLKQYQEDFSTYEPVEGRGAEDGDEVNVEFSYKLGDKVIYEDDDCVFNVGDDHFFPGATTMFKGVNSGSDFSFSCTLPEDHEIEEGRGMEITFAGNILGISEKVPHPVNDELAQLLSYESLDEMKEALEQSWKSEVSIGDKSQKFNEIMDVLLEKNEFAAPELWVVNEMNRMARSMKLSKDISEDDISILKERATRTVKVSYLLEKIFDKEDCIELTQEEIDLAAAREGEALSMSAQQFVEHVTKQGAYENFLSFQKHQKVIAFLLKGGKHEQ